MALNKSIVRMLSEVIEKRASVYDGSDSYAQDAVKSEKPKKKGEDQKLLRYGLLGAAITPTVNILGNVIKGRPDAVRNANLLENLRFYTGATSSTPFGVLRGLGSDAMKGFAGGAIVPIIKSTLDRSLDGQKTAGGASTPGGFAAQARSVGKSPGTPPPGPAVHQQVAKLPGMNRILPGAAKTTIGQGTFRNE